MLANRNIFELLLLQLLYDKFWDHITEENLTLSNLLNVEF